MGGPPEAGPERIRRAPPRVAIGSAAALAVASLALLAGTAVLGLETAWIMVALLAALISLVLVARA